MHPFVKISKFIFRQIMKKGAAAPFFNVHANYIVTHSSFRRRTKVAGSSS